MKKYSLITGLAILIILPANIACLSARAPDVYINTGPSSENVDSTKIPVTRNHEEARIELKKAYRQIQYLEYENQRLKEKVEKEKDRGDEYKHKYKKLKDKYED